MQLALVTIACLISLAEGSRYGLLRVGSPSTGGSRLTDKSGATARSSSRSLFDEDASLAFRQLFGYQVGLSLSMANGAQLSLSMLGQPAQLSMGNRAQLSLSMGSAANLAYDASGSSGTSRDSVDLLSTGVLPASSFSGGTRGGGPSVQDDVIGGVATANEESNSNLTNFGQHLGTGSVAAIAVVGAVAAVALVAALSAKRRRDTAKISSVNSVGVESL